MWPVCFWLPMGRGNPPVPVPSYFVLVVVGHILGWIGAWGDLGDAGFDVAWRLVIVGTTIVIGWLGSHLAYSSMVGEDMTPLDVTSGASVAGGLFFGFVSGAVVSLISGHPVESFFDGVAPWACIGVAVGRVGCLAAGCDFGRPASRGWPRITYPNWACSVPRLMLAGSPAFLDHVSRGWIAPGTARSLPVHPVPLYYAFFLALAGVTTASLPPVLELDDLPGTHRYMIVASAFAVVTWLVEPLRGDVDRGLWRGASMAQWASLIVVFFCGLAWVGRFFPPRFDWIPGACAGTISVVALDLVLVSAASRRRSTASRWWTWSLNRGTTGGLLGRHSKLVTALSVALLCVPLAIGAYLGREGAHGTASFLGGALANTLHRVRFGGFVDYFRIPETRWACNLGDLALLTGILLWIL